MERHLQYTDASEKVTRLALVLTTLRDSTIPCEDSAAFSVSVRDLWTTAETLLWSIPQ